MVKKILLIIGVLCIAVYLLHPLERSFNYVNAVGLEEGLQGFLVSQNVELKNLSCHMVGTSRGGYCLFQATAQEFAPVKKALQLEALPRDKLDNIYEAHSSYHPCTTMGWGWNYPQDTTIELYQAVPALPALPAFKASLSYFVHLWYKPGSGEGCVDTQYRFG